MVATWLAAHSSSSDNAQAESAKRMRAVLVSALGRLNVVWADNLLKDTLLALPLLAMKLLLSSDQLTVDSEDTVLYTAQQYVRKQHRPAVKLAARGALAKLVRCPHLSRSVLSAVVLTSDYSLLLACVDKQLRQLLSLQLAMPATAGDELLLGRLKDIPDIPASWKLGRRRLCEQGPVSVVWRLPVQQLAEACRSCTAANVPSLHAPDSPPAYGTAWRLKAYPTWEDKGGSGVKVGLAAFPVNAPTDTFSKVKCYIQAGGITRSANNAVKSGQACGWPDFFGIGSMSGWDEAAWAAKGLPTSGELEIKLTVHY